MPPDSLTQQIFEAWYEAEFGDPRSRSGAEKRRDELVEQALQDTAATVDSALDYLWPFYKDYKLSRRRKEKTQIADAPRFPTREGESDQPSPGED